MRGGGRGPLIKGLRTSRVEGQEQPGDGEELQVFFEIGLYLVWNRTFSPLSSRELALEEEGDDATAKDLTAILTSLIGSAPGMASTARRPFCFPVQTGAPIATSLKRIAVPSG